eukprot:gene13221-biopygen9549
MNRSPGSRPNILDNLLPPHKLQNVLASSNSCITPDAWGHRTLARAWRGHGAGVTRAIGNFWLGVARAWRGRGAGISCSPWDFYGTPFLRRLTVQHHSRLTPSVAQKLYFAILLQKIPRDQILPS